MTRPPFAEFSSLAVRELTAWTRGRAPWPARLDAVVFEHVSPLVGEAGEDVNEILETMDEREGELFGVALEDLCTRRYADPPEIVSVVPGHGMTVRDLLAEGDPVEVVSSKGGRTGEESFHG